MPNIYICMCVYIYIYTHNGLLFSHEKKDNPAIYYNTDGTWGHYAKWNEPEINTAWYHSYVESGKKQKSKRHMHPNVHCSTIYNSQVMEAT